MTSDAVDIPLTVVRRGYDRAQVEEWLNRFLAERDEAVATAEQRADESQRLGRELDNARGAAQSAATTAAEALSEVERLTRRVAELSAAPQSVDGMSERLQQVARSAQENVDEMRRRATVSAAQVRNLAQEEADELRERSLAERRDFEARQEAAEEALRIRSAQVTDRLDHLERDADVQLARFDDQLAERKAIAEAELAAEAERHRASLLAEIAEEAQRRRMEAARILESASELASAELATAQAEAQRVRAEAQHAVVDAQRELSGLRSLRDQLAEQLTSVSVLLDWTLPQLVDRPAGESAAHQPAPPAELAPPAAAPPSTPEPRPSRQRQLRGRPADLRKRGT